MYRVYRNIALHLTLILIPTLYLGFIKALDLYMLFYRRNLDDTVVVSSKRSETSNKSLN